MKKPIDWENANSYSTDLTPDQWREEFLQRSELACVDVFTPKGSSIYIGRGDELRILVEAGYCLAQIDLTRPISPQIRRIEKQIHGWQKTLISEAKAGIEIPPDSFVLKHDARKRKLKKLADYLQALDGMKAGSTYQKIWQTIYPQVKSSNPRRSGQRLVNAACEMQEHFRRNSAYPTYQLLIRPQPSPRCIWGPSSKKPLK